jgi:hypothetical protein
VAPLLIDSKGVLASTPDGLAMITGGSQVSLPRSAADWVTGQTIPRMRVVGASAAQAVQVNANTAIYVGTSPAVSTAASVALRDDESVVEFLTILHEPSAAREHEVQVELREGEQLVADSDRRAHIEDADGNVVALVDAPWAKDASGADVAFSMSVRGDRIVMDVPHHGNAHAYPIVVDPTVTFNCGIVTCSAYFSRGTTRAIADVGIVASLACTVIPTDFGRRACFAFGSALDNRALQCARNNQCLQIRFLTTATPVDVLCNNGQHCIN